MTDKAIHCLPLLTRTTFDDWRNVMFLFCLEKGVDDHLLSDLVTTERDPIAKATLKLQKGVAAGILGHNLGKALIAHFQSASAQNQSVVYQDFLKIRYTSSLEKFLTNIDLGLSHIRLVGIQIVKLEKHTLDEHLLAEYLVNLLPPKLESTKDLLLNKSPINIDTVKQYLNSKSLSLSNVNTSTDSDTVTIKSEAALKTVSVNCQDGVTTRMLNTQKQIATSFIPTRHQKLTRSVNF
ncbi:hypothetical protein PTTG_26247 [Puccinia triticina 1-1 BBBD Race 1]|uniref:Uncharacterized protein n=1 Tax=Puccinia triticina (isolate 1-1 / race 1 (BBBD)) TaxID=630390 RepID=A0A180GWM8_PUCT1|nr:hypothetical protein PTTG_26247 [Puccinia triticina 1-1 BBBD Race 1]